MISLIMKNKKLLVAIGLVTVFAACSLGDKGKVRHVRTPETVKLLANLKKVSALGFMIGHHDDTNYGIGDRKSTRLNSSHKTESRMPSSA